MTSFQEALSRDDERGEDYRSGRVVDPKAPYDNAILFHEHFLRGNFTFYNGDFWTADDNGVREHKLERHRVRAWIWQWLDGCYRNNGCRFKPRTKHVDETIDALEAFVLEEIEDGKPTEAN